MRNKFRRTINALGFFMMVGIVAAVPAHAVTINGGVAETGGITTPCNPCVGGTGIPVGTQGYVAQNPGGGVSNMTLVQDVSRTLIFHYLGSDAVFHNQFFIGNTLVFDNQRANNPDLAFGINAGAIDFHFISDIGGNNDTISGNPSTTFNIFEACLPNAGSPRTCNEGYIGLADGRIFNANDDHQDLGVQFRTPEPGTLSLLGAGLLGLGLVTLRRRKV
jgi:PEP-CTERM motif-containing protein